MCTIAEPTAQTVVSATHNAGFQRPFAARYLCSCMRPIRLPWRHYPKARGDRLVAGMTNSFPLLEVHSGWLVVLGNQYKFGFYLGNQYKSIHMDPYPNLGWPGVGGWSEGVPGAQYLQSWAAEFLSGWTIDFGNDPSLRLQGPVPIMVPQSKLLIGQGRQGQVWKSFVCGNYTWRLNLGLGSVIHSFTHSMQAPAFSPCRIQFW